jgi:hypothetical protein
MLPTKIRAFVDELHARTERGLFKWTYRDEAATVELDTPEFAIKITYLFDQVQEVGAFNIMYLSKPDHREYRFSTNQNYHDFERVSALFDSAQSSDLVLPLPVLDLEASLEGQVRSALHRS